MTITWTKVGPPVYRRVGGEEGFGYVCPIHYEGVGSNGRKYGIYRDDPTLVRSMGGGEPQWLVALVDEDWGYLGPYPSGYEYRPSLKAAKAWAESWWEPTITETSAT